jgi:hypothetical protein
MARLHTLTKQDRNLSRTVWAERLTLHATILMIALAAALGAIAT